MQNLVVTVLLLLSMEALCSVTKADAHRDVMNQFHDASIPAVNSRQNLNLSEYIWNNVTEDLLPQAWNTTFIAGVANGDMNPNFYGNYILQDAAYCRIVALLWMRLANNVSVNAEVREYANNSWPGFQDCSTILFNTWNVKDDGVDDYGVIVREPVREYVTFIEETMLASPPNTLIATYACLKLWSNLTGDLYPIVQNSTNNPYAVWVYENYGNRSTIRQANQMDEWDQKYQWYNWSEAVSLFRIAVMNEINFFDHAGNVSTTSFDLYRLQHPKPLLSYDNTHENS